MENVEFSGYNWYPHEEWGLIHPDKPWNWYSPSCIKVINEKLYLHVKPEPRIFELPVKGKPEETEKILSPNGIGLVSSKEYFGYGTFEIYAKLPKGKGLWPAFWLYDHNEWPPEIDIFEGYSGNGGNYKNGIIKRIFYPYNVESCFHSHKNIGIPNVRPIAYSRKQVRVSTYDPFKFNIYTLKWSPLRLVFSVNETITRVIDDPVIINYLKNRKMRVLINTHIQIGFADKYTQETPFVISHFKYIPL